MFTGIVEELGEIAAIEEQADAIRLTVRGPLVVSDAAHGDSIAVNGCCLTVTESDSDTFTVDVMRESLDKTSLGALRVGDPVNLERAMPATGRFGGHVVQGHVDATGTIRSRTPSEHWEVVEVAFPADLGRYLVPKGSITVDGTSLTVVDVTDDAFTVSLIPTTLAATTLGTKQPGDPVNLEVDVLAKYVEKMLGTGATGARG
ncbi:riboflavin synthase [Mumia zhuanghuii]|uniref:Riboflavin synthase n=1 Tax=Mumia zhuanghuii TaxID=2585211 RepID=A0A5C4ML97_9ACTN|nr:riboflavin synthase [Mumia zhuanghuii]TNC44128.1 riboflavin synthase [Mumia zhuanghuii]TNC47931.1 riboflavin synthase [Mumia zhuanghuii]